jgi:GSH-dependent disulfide-bond oxidoreductase
MVATKEMPENTPQKLIDLYYWPTPNGWKVSILLEELGLPYNLKLVNISKGDQFEPDFLKISPNNRMPAIVDYDVDGAPVTVFESGAILLYLAEKYGRFIPGDSAGRVQVIEWLFWQMGGLGPMMGQLSHFTNYAPQLTDSDISYSQDRYQREGHRLLGVINKRLENREFLAGEYSIADMACWPWVIPWERFGYDIEEFPNTKTWLDTIHARPAVKKGYELANDLRKAQPKLDDEAKKLLFGQK